MTDSDTFAQFEHELCVLRQNEEDSRRHRNNEDDAASRFDLAEERYGVRKNQFEARATSANPGLLLLLFASIAGVWVFLLLD
jgi:hypothetical protein